VESPLKFACHLAEGRVSALQGQGNANCPCPDALEMSMQTATSPNVDSNFQNFVDNWELFRNRLTIFLGAGASIGAKNSRGYDLMNAYELRNNLWRKFKETARTTLFDPQSLRLMSLEHAAAIIEATTGRTPLLEYLFESFDCNLPLWQHLALPYLNPSSLFTTNYDELVELGYAGNGRVVDVICNDRIPVSGRPNLFKPHGSLSHANQPIGEGGLVITQFDYFEMIGQYRQMLQNIIKNFGTQCVLVIGYSFGDMDIGSELYQIRKGDGGIPWYAVFPRNDPNVRAMYLARLGIRQIDCTFERFVLELDERVNFLPRHLKHDQIAELRSTGKIQQTIDSPTSS
jgi:hypothetical protein